ncbi:hypothetical protein ACN23B_13975 [Anabaena sp. FACHB-709]|nr:MULTISPECIES: hypothetical protein [Nostocaceae]MBD2171777.1 hypothetical protein [Anabaena cylindrica FACHB-318]MBD2264295.1 hypothetical protein [Anabaena sp. FACHB-709]MBD2273638.1 hypothetical protein [Nostoc sp. PCC 7120 = FACHB-418]MBD2281620.1 hypothetical protein [Anabaena cylindrica FACHB-170]MBD2347667.1 hypothetical protein [Trichormus variabilis FACHB-171]
MQLKSRIAYYSIMLYLCASELTEKTCVGHETKLIGHETELIGHETKLIGHETKLIGHETKLIGHETKLIGHETELIGHQTKLIRHETKLIVDDNLRQTASYTPRPSALTSATLRVKNPRKSKFPA